MANVCLDERERALWAKSDPYHPLWCHVLDTAAVCERLMECLGIQSGLPSVWTVFLAAVHDIGKADPKFQMLCEEQAPKLRELGLDLPSHKEEFRHEARSGDWIYDYLINREPAWGKYAARLASLVLQGHHGKFNPKFSRDESRQKEEWKRIRTHLADMVADVLGLEEEPFSLNDFTDASSTGLKLIGLTVLSDWIASNKDVFRFTDLNKNADPRDYWQQARIEAARAVEALRLASRDERPLGAAIPYFHDIWPEIDDLKPSQRTLEDACKQGIPSGLAIIEAPMGDGKTESAIYLAECWRAQYGTRGTYIALPTMATSNQMHKRYGDFLSKRRPSEANLRLVHGMAWLVDDVSPQSGPETFGENAYEEHLLAREWFRPSKRALIAPEAVGTVDQALMAALNVRHGFLRLFGLSSKVLIIDEVHAHDEYMTIILERLLEWCRALRVPVIMLSATLSLRQKRRLVGAYGGRLPDSGENNEPYPLITLVPMDGEPRLVCVEKQPKRTIRICQHWGKLDNALETARLAVDLVRDGGCACILTNTVKQAQAVFKELEKLDPSGKHHLFHARFPAWRRSEIEDQVVNLFGKEAAKNGTRPKRAVLVATQVVEQSLDLDFDVMISQLAPIDLLLQRVGRLWRRRDTPRPEGLEEALHILMPNLETHDMGDSMYVYGEAALIRTMAILESRKLFDLPNDFRPLIDACYGDGCVISSIISERKQMIADSERDRKRDLDAGKAAAGLIPSPSVRVFRLAEAAEARDESEEATDSYFSLSTRLERNTRSVLVLEDPKLIDAARRSTIPNRNVMKQLFLHKVDIPAYWLEDAIPADGYEAPIDGAKWLRGTVVVPTQGGAWRGLRKGEPFEIADNKILGMELSERCKE